MESWLFLLAILVVAWLGKISPYKLRPWLCCLSN